MPRKPRGSGHDQRPTPVADRVHKPKRKADGPRCDACGHLWASHAPNVGCQVLEGKRWRSGDEVSGIENLAPKSKLIRCRCKGVIDAVD